MGQTKHFLYETRSGGIHKANWAPFRAVVDRLHAAVAPMSGSAGSDKQVVVVRNDESTVSLKLGHSEVTIRRLWRKDEYQVHRLPPTLEIDSLSDLFVRSVYLALFFHAPASAVVELRSTGCMDGWNEARHLFEQTTGQKIDLHLMDANEQLCKGFSTPLPKTGDAHLIGLAEKVTGIPNPSDMGEPEVSMDGGDVPTTASKIPFVSHSWFF